MFVQERADADVEERHQEIKAAAHTRLRHYLRSYRKRNNLTIAEMAKKVGYTQDHYRKFEASTPENRFSSAVLFINSFAEIDGMDLTTFIHYLFPTPSHQHGELFPWEKILLTAFHKIAPEIRSEFCHGLCSKATKSGPLLSKVSQLVQLASAMAKLSADELDAVELLVKRLTSQRVGYEH